MITNCWWGQTNEGMKIHWKIWAALTKTKEDGVLGFRELETFNVALLTKMIDRLIKEPNSLWVRVMKGIYYPRGEFISSRKGGRAS